MSNTYLKLFVDSLERYQKLSDAEFGRLIRAGLIYKATGTVPELNGREELLFDGMKLDIDRDNEQYTATCAARSEAGRRGAEARWNGNCHLPDSKNSKSHLPYGKNGQDKEEDKEEDKEKEKHNKPLTRFVPPTAEEVKAYCLERQNGIDANTFVNFYAAKGWMIGKNRMKDWKAAVRTWERNSNQTQTKPNSFDARSFLMGKEEYIDI